MSKHKEGNNRVFEELPIHLELKEHQTPIISLRIHFWRLFCRSEFVWRFFTWIAISIELPLHCVLWQTRHKTPLFQNHKPNLKEE